jgi:hypothetical protein
MHACMSSPIGVNCGRRLRHALEFTAPAGLPRLAPGAGAST